ncbi:MAG: GAF domain-containing protein, partial [Proteobacteria bacterium]|nr:GAF domain-containing protein [Pseudomonadota bacterium]
MSNKSPIYNSRIIKTYLEYLSKHYPDVDIDSLLDYAKMIKPEVEDPAHWFSQHQVDLFHEILQSKTNNPNIYREVGRYGAISKASGLVRQYVLGFVTPGAAYSMLARIASKLSRAQVFRTRQIAGNKVEITVTLAPGVKENPHQCENRIGLFEAMAKLFTNKFARVEHPHCLHKGAQVGRYIITWEKVPSLLWKQVRNYSLLLGILSSLALFFILPITPWAIVSLLFALLTLILSCYSSYLEKKEHVKTIESQGDVAEELLSEMNIRYNNALLVQEIGQATSTILDIDKFVNTVVTVMERRLDFDRGMIMLANQEQTRLIYAGGYGYSKEQEKLLQGTEFHLDRTESKGMFVLAYNKQKSFLINDIAENEKELSKRSQELARQMGTQSFICVPIIYEQKSLGILTVDNIKSKR